MIIVNGYIKLYRKAGATVDSEHNPIAPTYDIVNIPCQYEQKSRSNNGKTESGKYTLSSYDIFVDISNSAKLQGASKIVLVSNIAGTLGEFDMSIPRYLEVVGQIKISV